MGVYLHTLLLHMGVTWSSVIACLPTHTLLVFLCVVVFLFVWTSGLGWGEGISVVVIV